MWSVGHWGGLAEGPSHRALRRAGKSHTHQTSLSLALTGCSHLAKAKGDCCCQQSIWAKKGGNGYGYRASASGNLKHLDAIKMRFTSTDKKKQSCSYCLHARKASAWLFLPVFIFCSSSPWTGLWGSAGVALGQEAQGLGWCSGCTGQCSPPYTPHSPLYSSP